MKTTYAYITFILAPVQFPKTSAWYCKDIQGDSIFGVVKYYPAWRQYCYFPLDNTIFNDGCLRDIADFLSQLDNDRKEKNKKIKEQQQS